MSKKQAIILLALAPFAALLLLQPLNYFCKISDLCQPIAWQFYFPWKKGDKSFDVVFAAKNASKSFEIKPLTDSINLQTGENFEVKYLVKNLSDKEINLRLHRMIKPMKAMKYLKFYECLCFQEYRIKAGEERALAVRFRIDPEIEKDEKLKNLEKIEIGYEF